MSTEVAGRADFSAIRYAQCWEDADLLMQGLNLSPGFRALSISSAGENSLSLLAAKPERVIAVDLSSAQLACLELRVVGYRVLQHAELLELIGSRPSARRAELYARCRPQLSLAVQEFWDASPEAIAAGIGSAGKFERYFAMFRNRVLPLVHSRRTVLDLLKPRTREEREEFYEKRWNTWRWRLLFKVFFSRTVMGRLGRDPSFFTYVEGSVANRILARARYALTELSPTENPYLHWILTGTHGDALPFALREENFEAIRSNLHKLEWRQSPIEDVLNESGADYFDAYNLSDIFEYMSAENTATLLERLANCARDGARLGYWNMLAPRSRPESLAHMLKPQTELAAKLFAQDKAFFYSAFILEEVAK